MNSNSYTIVRSGILDHLVAGRLGFFELGIYVVILLQADFRTGVWWGSAPRLLANCPRGTSLRRVQQALKTLSEIGFLRSFHVHGKRGNYPVLIDKYDVKLGALTGKRLNAWKSVSWSSPCYGNRAETDAEEFAGPCTDDAPNQEPIDKRQKAKITHRRSAPVGGNFADDGFDRFYSAYPKRQAKKDAQRAWQKLSPEDRAAAMAAIEKSKETDQWTRDNGRYIPQPAKFLNGRRWEDEIPAPSSTSGGVHGTGKGRNQSGRAGGEIPEASWRPSSI